MTVGDISTYYCQHRQSGRQAGREAMSMNGLFLNVYGFINQLDCLFLERILLFFWTEMLQAQLRDERAAVIHSNKNVVSEIFCEPIITQIQ